MRGAWRQRIGTIRAIGYPAIIVAVDIKSDAWALAVVVTIARTTPVEQIF